jgi:hypothetical protein
MAISNQTTQLRPWLNMPLGPTTGDPQSLQKFQVYNDEVYERRVVHQFNMSYVEDPEVYVAQPIYEWQQTDHGKWVMKNGKNIQYHMQMSPAQYTYQITITAHVTAKRWTEYCLRFPIDIYHNRC